MLTDVNTGLEVVHVPRRAGRELDEVLSRLSREQIAAMEIKIEELANAVGDERTDFLASNWLTGSDWNEVADGVFQPLYESCLDYHANPVEYAGWMFGWLVRRAMIRLGRSAEWCLYKNPEAGTDEAPRNMWGTFYWRANRRA